MRAASAAARVHHVPSPTTSILGTTSAVAAATGAMPGHAVLGSGTLGHRQQQVRHLNVHECSGIQILQEFGVPTPKGVVATTPEQAEELYASSALGGASADIVIKAQVLAGGRGRGTFKNGFRGGVHVVTHPGEARDLASKMLNQILVTKQTGPEGKIVDKVFLMERLYLRREMYFSILMDRESNGPVLVGSPAGGMSIEDVAEETPELIFTEAIDIIDGLQPEQASRMAANLGLEDSAAEQCTDVIMKLYDMFLETDATLIEINPLAETPDGNIFVCDAKLNFDDNAEFRQTDVFRHRDRAQEDPREVEVS